VPMGPAPFLGIGFPAMMRLEVSMSEKIQPPCLEEFVAAGYPAENYEKHFAALRELGEEWGDTWSNPNWKPAPPGLAEVPERLMVHSAVRNPQTRIARKLRPGRKAFKQHIFMDSTKRLVRGRPVAITSAELAARFDVFCEAERVGTIEVRTLDGRRLDLQSLRSGSVCLAAPAASITIPNTRLDSAANDEPAGIPLSQYSEGTFVGDPAAERVVERMTNEKVDEGIRQGALDGPEDQDGPAVDEDFDDSGTSATEVALPDPAAARSSQSGKTKKRR